MGAGLEIYGANGDVLLSHETKALEVQARTQASYVGTLPANPYVPPSIIKNTFPTGGGYTGYRYRSGYENADAYGDFLAFKPSVLGDTLGIASDTNDAANVRLVNYRTSGASNGVIDVISATAASPTNAAGVLDVYDEEGILAWSLFSLANCVKIIAAVPMSVIMNNNGNYPIYTVVPIPHDIDPATVYLMSPFDILQHSTNILNMSTVFFEVRDRNVHLRAQGTLGIDTQFIVASIPSL